MGNNILIAQDHAAYICLTAEHKLSRWEDLGSSSQAGPVQIEKFTHWKWYIFFQITYVLFGLFFKQFDDSGSLKIT